MKKTPWIILFIALLLTDLVAVYLGNKLLQWICKPVLIPVLIGYFLFSTQTISSPLKKWVVLALLFSWAGDILLMVTINPSLFFILGLSAFLIAHLFYILFYHSIRLREQIPGKVVLLLPVVIYYFAMMSWLNPYLGGMKLPVRIYAVVISFMFMLSMHMLCIKNRAAALWMIIGAALFLLSDSILAINKFYMNFEYSGIATMITYGLAQLFITTGATKYIQEEK
jgi:uncharacterized membrane protein YhhN